MVRSDEIAVIGMACRLPGASCLQQYWSNLRGGVESIRFLTEAELLAAGVDPAVLARPNYVRSCGGWLDGAGLFDAAFWGMTPREAEILDPQHRLFLESCWEALEHAGYDSERVAGHVGVFGGASRPHYFFDNVLARPDLLEAVGAVQAALASDKDSLATRVSYELDLRGPSLTVQTACSTSLVAIHVACQSVLSGECDLALAGGVSVTAMRAVGYLYEEGGTYSPDGHCRAFDAAALGMVGGDGVAVVVLKRLEDALRDHDTVWAVVKGSAIGNDGARRVGFAAPGLDGQARVIRDALAFAGVDARTIGMVEGHGTGTTLGDPIEIAALTQAWREHTADRQFCALGSVKTNIGHTNAAAGAAGFVKVVLSLAHRQIPPSLHFVAPNRQIDFDRAPVFVNRELRDFAAVGDAPRRAAVSAFGMGGTNAHAILEEAPPPAMLPASRFGPQILTLSAKSATAVAHYAKNLAEHLGSGDGAALADTAFTLQLGRRALPHRQAVVAATAAEAAALLSGREPNRVVQGTVLQGAREVAFLFPGQGAQHPNMARGLYDCEPSFRADIDHCAAVLQPHLGLDLRTLLFPAPGDEDAAAARLAETCLTQPALFVIEYALAKLWASVGVRPKVMVGHSVGEFVAACLAGVFALPDALRLVAVRGRLMQSMPAGAMLAVPLPEAEVATLLGPDLSVCVVNGPESCVVGGPAAAVDAFEAQLRQRRVAARRLHTSHAFHSAMMAPIVEPFVAAVRQTLRRRVEPAAISTVTGIGASADEWEDPAYWGRNLRQPVRFAQAVATLLTQPELVLLEVGPGQTLTALVKQQGPAAEGCKVLASLRHPKDTAADDASFLRAVAGLWAAGVTIDWQALHGGPRRRVPLPTYPFERRRFWVEPRSPAGLAPSAVLHKLPIDDWFWLPSWQRTAPRQPPADMPAAAWLVFLDGRGLGERIVERLRADGQAVLTVAAGPESRRLGPEAFVLDPAARAGYDEPLAALRALGSSRCIVLHLWALDAAEGRAIQDRGFHSLLALSQAIARERNAGPLRVHVVTERLHEVAGEPVLRPQSATVLGPCAVLPQEYPHVACSILDLDHQQAETESAVQWVVGEAASSATSAPVASRGGWRWVRDFVRTALPVPPPPPVAGARRVYLVTGGLGGVGSVLAEHLARQGPAVLVLVGRSGLPARSTWAQVVKQSAGNATARKIRSVQQLEALGAEVVVAPAQVEDASQIRAVVARVKAQYGAIHGVIHAAGVPSGRMIPDTTADLSDATLAPKVQGTVALAAALAGEPLQFLALCSSLAAIVGGLGAIDYCAANCFLDAFAAAARGQGVPAVSINWDTWKQVGTAVDVEVSAALRVTLEQALRDAIAPAEGVEAFARVVAQPFAQVLVSTRDFSAFLQRARAARESEPNPATDSPTSPTIYADGNSAPRNEIERAIARIVQDLTGVERIGRDDSFFELGIDSLHAIRIVSRLRSALNVELPLRAVLESPSVAALALVIEPVGVGQTERDDWAI